jgi:hypothetical protein
MSGWNVDRTDLGTCLMKAGFVISGANPSDFAAEYY